MSCALVSKYASTRLLVSREGICRKTYRKLALDLPDRAVKLAGNCLLLIVGEKGESLAKITIDDAFHRDVVATIHKMISAR